MTYRNYRLHPRMSVRFAVALGAIGISFGVLATTTSAAPKENMKGEAANLRDDAETLLKGNRSLLAKVLAVSSDQIKVDIGEVQPRYLPLKQARQ